MSNRTHTVEYRYFSFGFTFFWGKALSGWAETA